MLSSCIQPLYLQIFKLIVSLQFGNEIIYLMCRHWNQRKFEINVNRTNKVEFRYCTQCLKRILMSSMKNNIFPCINLTELLSFSAINSRQSSIVNLLQKNAMLHQVHVDNSVLISIKILSKYIVFTTLKYQNTLPCWNIQDNQTRDEENAETTGKVLLLSSWKFQRVGHVNMIYILPHIADVIIRGALLFSTRKWISQNHSISNILGLKNKIDE